jgi:hypothetical protein
MRATLKRSLKPVPPPLNRWWTHPQFRDVMLIAAGMAFVWWLASFGLRALDVIVWHDQFHIFQRSTRFIDNPYVVEGFLHPVWVPIGMIPFAALQFEVSILVQAVLYFTALGAVMLKFGGDRRAVMVTLTSYMALDAVLEMNIDWMVIVGLLLPVWMSSIFVMAKPQIGLGYYIGVPVRQWPLVALVTAVFLALTFAVWGNWVAEILARVTEYSINRSFNIAPFHFLTPYLSVPIGLTLSFFAFRRKDVPLALMGWIFFTPYLSFYSLPLPFAMLAIRSPRTALIFTVVMWIVFGGTIGTLLIRAALIGA